MPDLILLVEEDRATCATICDMLEALGYQVLGVNTFERARIVMSDILFDVLIIIAKSATNIEQSYAAAAKTVRPSIKVILVSPNPLPRYLSPSIDGFIVKPFLLELLGDSVVAVLRKLH